MNKIIFLFSFFFSNILCSQIAFEDVASNIGVDYSYGDSEYGGGVSFADFNNDGWDDITYASEDGAQVYFFKELMFVMDEKENYDIFDTDVEKIKQHIKERIQ